MTDEPAELVIPWIAAHKVTHPVVILTDGALESTIGVKGYPTSAIFLGTEMKWKGHPSRSNASLAEVRKVAKKDSVYPKKLSKVIATYNKGDMVKTMLNLQKLMPKLEGDTAAWAGRLEVSLLGQAARTFTRANEAVKEGFWFHAMEVAEPYLGKGSPYPSVEEMRSSFASLAEEKLYAKEISGGKLYVKAQGQARAKEYIDAVKTYKSILKKCAGTQIAEHARTAGEELIQGRRPGFKPTCPSCRKNRGDAACSKHFEEMKL